MARLPQEDLFDTSTMTFGEHLEELRACLMRALFGLGLGTLVGFLVATHAVHFIKAPLEAALQEHFSILAKNELKGTYADGVTEDMLDFVQKRQMVFDEVFLESAELQRLLQLVQSSPPQPPSETGKIESTDPSITLLDELLDEKLPPPTLEMVKTRLWRPAKARLTSLSPTEGFMIWMKAALVVGLILSSPYVFYQAWIFVAAGLYPHEKRYVYVYIPFSLGLFLAGAATAFFFVFGPVLNFLFGFGRMLDITPDLRISEVISFVLFLPIGFGIAFQLPLVMLFLHRVGIFEIKAYIEKWRVAVLVIFVISMMLTPADPYSMMLMALPLSGLYALGIGLCKWMPRGKNPFDGTLEEM